MISSFLRHFATKKLFSEQLQRTQFLCSKYVHYRSEYDYVLRLWDTSLRAYFPIISYPILSSLSTLWRAGFPACLILFTTKLRFVVFSSSLRHFQLQKNYFLNKYRESNFFVASLPIFVANTTMFLPAEMPQFPAFLTSSFFSFQLSWVPAYLDFQLIQFQLISRFQLVKIQLVWILRRVKCLTRRIG